MVPIKSAELAYISRSRDLLTERLYTVPMSARSRVITKSAIERLNVEAMRLHWGLPRFATKNPR